MKMQRAFEESFDAVKRYIDGITDQVEERLIAIEKRQDAMEKALPEAATDATAAIRKAFDE